MKESYTAQAYFNYMHTVGDLKKQPIIDFYHKLISYKKSFLDLLLETYLYYHMWNQILVE